MLQKNLSYNNLGISVYIQKSILFPLVSNVHKLNGYTQAIYNVTVLKFTAFVAWLLRYLCNYPCICIFQTSMSFNFCSLKTYKEKSIKQPLSNLLAYYEKVSFSMYSTYESPNFVHQKLRLSKTLKDSLRNTSYQ